MDYQELAQSVINKALKAGADEAEVYLEAGKSSQVSVRKGEVETIRESSPKMLGLRVWTKKRLGFCSTNNFAASSLDGFIKDTVALAKYSGEDAYNGLPESLTVQPWDLGIHDRDTERLSMDTKIEWAKRAEAAALKDSRVSRDSEGAVCGSGSSTVVLANTLGFTGTYSGTYASLSCSPLAEENGKKETDEYYTQARAWKDLLSPEEVGRIAAERTTRKLGSRKVKSQKVPVIFDPWVAASFWGIIFGALDGDAIYRKMSFLEGKLGEKIASPLVNLIDDGRLIHALGTAPFDGEGVPQTNKTVIDAGTLNSYFYTAYSARRSNARPTGNAQRSASSLPAIGATNLYLKPGNHSLDQLIGDIKEGLLLTGTMGHGVNTVTGEYSLGASGLWIQNGKIVYPVSEITVAANMRDILLGIEGVGSDLMMTDSVSSPSFRVREMSIGGT